MSKIIKVGHKSARKKRRESLKVFNRHRILFRSNDKLAKIPDWKISLQGFQCSK